MVEVFRSTTPSHVSTTEFDIMVPSRTMYNSLSARKAFREVKIPTAIATPEHPISKATILPSIRATSSPLPDRNPLLDTKIAEVIMTPDAQHLTVPSTATSVCSPLFDIEMCEALVSPTSSMSLENNPLLDIPVPEVILTPERQNFDISLRSPRRRHFSSVSDRNSMTDTAMPEALIAPVSPPTLDNNPLLDVPVPEVILTPERQNFELPLRSPSRRTFSSTAERKPRLEVEASEVSTTSSVQHIEVHSSPFQASNPLLDVPVPDAILTPERQDFESPLCSPTRRTFLPATHRNPLHDVEIPNEIVAPDFQHSKPSPLPTIYSVRPLSSLSCPPTLPSNEWSLFITELERAAVLSKRQKTVAVAVGISEPIGTPVVNGVLTWGMWRHLAVRKVKPGMKSEVIFEHRRKRDSITAVVTKWNERWVEKGVKIALEVKNKRDTRLKSRKSHHSNVRLMSEDSKPEVADSEGASELEEDLREFQMIQEVM